MKNITKIAPDPGTRSYNLVNLAEKDIYIHKGVSYLSQTIYKVGLYGSKWDFDKNPYPTYSYEYFSIRYPRKALVSMRLRSEYGVITLPGSSDGRKYYNSTPQQLWDNAHYVVDLGYNNFVDPIDWVISSTFEFDVVQGEFKNWVFNPSIEFGVSSNNVWTTIGNITKVSFEDSKIVVGKDLVLFVGAAES